MTDKNTISSTSQNFLDIYDIINNIVILKNGSTSVILSVNAMNFGLLAEQEQDAVIYAYAGLLNSLNFPIQIVIQSQTKDISTYLKLLEEQGEEATDEKKRVWIKSYSQFVNDLIKERNVIDKKFFVVIPASSLEMGLTLAQNVVSGFKEQNIEGIEKNVILEKAQSLLEPKRDHIIAQFNRIGLLAHQLTTQEIIRLFYTNYNPEATEGQEITDSQSYTTALVQAQVRGNFMKTPATPATPTNPIAPTAPASPIAPIASIAKPAEEISVAESPIITQPTTTPTPAPTPTMVPAPSMTPIQATEPIANKAPGEGAEKIIQDDINHALKEIAQKPKL
ncbi:hypothetical protein KKE34_05265 [Patescibacteria group bacterium]|nr:hypothetical protein [Patescibacteria group bacterium]